MVAKIRFGTVELEPQKHLAHPRDKMGVGEKCIFLGRTRRRRRRSDDDFASRSSSFWQLMNSFWAPEGQNNLGRDKDFPTLRAILVLGM